MCSSLSPYKHSNSALALAADMQPWRGMEALHREEGKQGMHQQISIEESQRQAGRREGLQRETSGWTRCQCLKYQEETFSSFEAAKGKQWDEDKAETPRAKIT